MKLLTRAVPLVALVGFLVLIGLGGCSATSEGLSDLDSVAADKTALDIGYAGTDSATSVTQALTLPSAGDSGTTISWTSSDTAVIADTGAVTRPDVNAANDASVTLTATIEKNGVSDTKTFTLTVKKEADLSDASLGYGNIAMLTGATTGNTASPTWSVPDTDVSYSITGSPSGATQGRVTINGNTGEVTVDTDAVGADSGTYTVEAKAEDTSTSYTGTATQDFTLTVNAKPGSPSITSATPTDAGGIDLAWTLPTETGYSGTTPEALTALEITINPAPTSGEATRSVSASATTETITGLASGTAYSFTMTASNIHGKSTASNEKSATTKSDLSTATLSYPSALTRDFNATAVDSGSPSWAGGPGTPASPTYSIAAATTGAPPTEDGTTLSSDGISINTTSGLITVGTAVEVKHSGDYVVTATAAAGDANYIAGSTATLTVPVTVKAIAIANLDSAEFSLTVTDTTVTALTGGTHTATVGGSPSLTAGTDYDLSIKKDGAAVTAVTINNAGLVSIADTIGTGDAGIYTVKATGKGNYKGEKTVTFTLTVNSKDIATVTGFSILVDAQTVPPLQASTFPVTINNAGLTAGTDYGLSIEKDGAAVNAVTIDNSGQVSIADTIGTGDTGIYTVKATGEGNYTGEVTGGFELTVAYSVGNTGPAGGIVFYDKGLISDGWRYLEAAPQDHSVNVQWGTTGTVGTATAIGSGKANTAAIVAALSDNGGTDYAAKICSDLVLGGYGDWFLPSKDELAELYKEKASVGDLKALYYWSSSEFSSNGAWAQYFSNGSQSGSTKYGALRVRAVRAF